MYVTALNDVGAYATLREANRIAMGVVEGRGYDEQKTSYNGDDGAYLKVEKDDGHRLQVEVKRMRVMLPGEKEEEGEEEKGGREERGGRGRRRGFSPDEIERMRITAEERARRR